MKVLLYWYEYLIGCWVLEVHDQPPMGEGHVELYVCHYGIHNIRRVELCVLRITLLYIVVLVLGLCLFL